MQSSSKALLAMGAVCLAASSVHAVVTPYSTAVSTTPGLLVYYQLDEPLNSPNVSDTTANTGPGAVGVGATVGFNSAYPNLGSAANFNGAATAAITVPNNGVLNIGTGAYSLELWYKTNTTGRTDVLTYKSADGGNDLGIQSNPNSTDKTLSYYHGNYLATATNVSDNTWHYVVATRSAAGAVKLYVDGALGATGTDTASITQTTAPLFLGSNHDGSLNPALTMNGSLDEVAFYEVELTAAQIATHYAAAPEPTSFAVLGLGAFGFLARRRRSAL